MRHLLPLAAALWLTLGACATTPDPGGAPIPPATGGDDGWSCCAPGPPSCGCFTLGGSAAPGYACAPSQICDARPEGWELGTDERGCPIWECPPGAACNGSCLAR